MTTALVQTERSPRLPGPPRWPILGWQLRALQMLSDPLAHFMRSYRRFGALSAWDYKKPRHVYAFGPELNEEIFGSPDLFHVDAFRESRLPKNSSMERLSFGLMRRNGAEHRRHRKLVQPAFVAKRVEAYRDAIVRHTEQELGAWKVGDVRRIDHDLTKLITFISMDTMFGLEPRSEGTRLHGLIQRLLALAGSPATLLLRLAVWPTPYFRMLRFAAEIETLVRSLIRRKRESSRDGGDVLSALVAARDESGSGFDEDDLVGEAYTVLCHESSAASLTWTIFLLDQHPTVLRAVLDELHAVLRGRAPSVEQLNELVTLDAVLKESLRLFPPAAFGVRYTSRDCRIGPFALPKDAMLFVSSFVTHRVAAIYEDPLRFEPARWGAIKPSIYEYIPFGAGAHHCVGRQFALLEIKIVLAMLLQRFRPSIVSGTRIDRGMRISLVPNGGLPVVLGEPDRPPTRALVSGNIQESLKLDP